MTAKSKLTGKKIKKQLTRGVKRAVKLNRRRTHDNHYHIVIHSEKQINGAIDIALDLYPDINSLTLEVIRDKKERLSHPVGSLILT